MTFSPYAPPAENVARPPPGYGGWGASFPYEPLGWKTTGSIVGIVLMVVLGVAVTGLTWAVGAENFAGNLPAAGAVAALGLLLSGVSIFTYVVFLVWMHAAAKNVRSFGCEGLEFTPGWVVGWWFIPFMNWVKPFQAMRELWNASDPDAIGRGSLAWRSSRGPSTLGVWWATYLLGGVVGVVGALVGFGEPGGSVGFSMASHFFRALSAVALVPIMRGLAQRQEQSHERQREAAFAPPPPPPAAGYGPPGYPPYVA